MQRAIFKKQQGEPLVIFLRLYGEEKRRVQKLCRPGTGRKHNAIAYAGLLAEIDRLEKLPPSVTAAEARAIAAAKKVGVDPIEALTFATEAHLAESESLLGYRAEQATLSAARATPLLVSSHD